MGFMKNLFGNKKGDEKVAENIVKLNAENYEQEVLNANKPVLIDFWAPWCGPCRMLTPIIEEIANEYEGKAKICKFNTDENQQFVSQFGIRGIPTMIIFKDGQEVKRLVGLRQKPEIADVLDSLI